MNFVTDQTVYKYISSEGQERIKRMFATKNYVILPDVKADIFRLHLIYEHGGMWLDLNSFFV